MIRERKMSKAEHKAMRFLRENGQCTLDRYGRVTALDDVRCSCQAQTFLRLVVRGYVGGMGTRFLNLTARGLEVMRNA